jgi:uncharacterized protein YndB with AHSA1/START domain
MSKDSGAHQFSLTRSIRASPTHLYAAFTRPEGWCEWCCETAEADARLGGKLHIYTEGYNAYGEFTALEPDRTIAFTWNGDREPPMLIQVTVDGQGDATTLTFAVTGLGSEDEWAAFAATLERIWAHTLDNLKAVLEAKPKS